MLLRERCLQPLPITQWIVQTGRSHFHEVTLHGRIDINVDLARGFAHKLLHRPAFLRHENHQRPVHLGHTTLAQVRVGEPFRIEELFLLLGHRIEVAHA